MKDAERRHTNCVRAVATTFFSLTPKRTRSRYPQLLACSQRPEFSCWP